MAEADVNQRGIGPARRWRPALIWGLYALLLLGAPLVFDSGHGQTILAQMGIAIIACLSYNLLLGQGGMLSFGHAVYTGMGAFLAIHTLNHIGTGGALPVSLVPLAGGMGSAGLALALGWVCTRRPGTAFAMITFGLGELVWAAALMFPGFFGGEAGISGNRAAGGAPWGISFGPQHQLVMLIAVYTLGCTALMFALTRTPLGRLLNAARDNSPRLAYLGPDPHRVRWQSFVISAFFAGVAGGLAALNFELVTAEVFSAERSAAYLLFTMLGGSWHFVGPIIGAILMVLAYTLLSGLTQAWLLYVGLAFVGVVMLAPGGVSALALLAWHALWDRRNEQTGRRMAVQVIAWSMMLAGLVGLVELLYHLQHQEVLGTVMRLNKLIVPVNQPAPWWTAAGLFLAGLMLLWRCRRRQPQAQGTPVPDQAGRGLEIMPLVADPDDRAVAPVAPHVGVGSAPVLVLDQVGKCFGNAQILQPLSLEVFAGESIGIIGPNGAGKSTLFDLISGRQAPSGGQIRLKGSRIDGLAPYEISRLGLARSFQTSALFARLSVLDNLRCALLWSHGHNDVFWRSLDSLADVSTQADHLMQSLQLAAQRDTLAQHLNYADQRALELGLALAGGAQILLLDEPTAGMSRAQANHFVQLIRRTCADKTLLIVEHNMQVLFGLVDKIAVMSAGELLAFDTPAAVRANARVQLAYLGQSDPSTHGT
jgi:branched-chain amino acid transport system permease protein